MLPMKTEDSRHTKHQSSWVAGDGDTWLLDTSENRLRRDACTAIPLQTVARQALDS